MGGPPVFYSTLSRFLSNNSRPGESPSGPFSVCTPKTVWPWTDRLVSSGNVL